MNQVKNYQKKFNIDISLYCYLLLVLRGYTLFWLVQPQTSKFQGLFRDLPKTNYSLQGLILIYSMNRHSLTAPFWTSYWLNHIMESCIIFTSSAMVDRITKYTTFHYNTYGKWLGLTYNCIRGTETAFKVRNRSEILLMHKNGFRQGSEFKGVLMT